MITLLDQLQQIIYKQMKMTFPNEGGGFLLGDIHDDKTLIQEIIQIENVFEREEQHHRYAMTPQDWIRLEDEADSRGLTLAGYYHSHPNSPAIPSEFDRVHALPNFVYLITSVMDGKAVAMRAWRLRPDRTQFDEQPLAIVRADIAHSNHLWFAP